MTDIPAELFSQMCFRPRNVENGGRKMEYSLFILHAYGCGPYIQGGTSLASRSS